MCTRVAMTEVYRDWINGLTDIAARARIQVRVDRLAHGNPVSIAPCAEACLSSRSTLVPRIASITRSAAGC